MARKSPEAKRRDVLSHRRRRLDPEYREKERAKNRERSRELHRDRAYLDARNARLRRTPRSEQTKARCRKAAARYRERYPERYQARRLVRGELEAGRLIRPDRCESCHEIPRRRRDGITGIQAHHDDYGQPLAVTWLCAPCHNQRHRELAAALASYREGESR